MNNRLNLLDRYLFSTVGMFLVAAGVSLSIISNLGTAPLSCIAYVASLEFPAISVGVFTWVLNLAFIVIQLAVLGKRFKLRLLLQIPAIFIFGFMIDGCMAMLDWLQPSSIAARIGLIVLACFITALGTSMEVIARTWMLSAEQTVNVLCDAYHLRFSTVKIVMDSLCVVISMALSFIFFGNFFAQGAFTGIGDVLTARMQGIVVGLGTLILAILAGLFMRITTPFVRKATKSLYNA